MKSVVWLALLAGTSACGAAFVGLPNGVPCSGLRRSNIRAMLCKRGALGGVMQLREGEVADDSPGDRNVNRRRALSAALAAASMLVGQKAAYGDILDIVTGKQKRDDVLARLKVGKVYLPTLQCNSSMPCWDNSTDLWYDYPKTFEGYTKSPSGVSLKDLPPRRDLAEISETAPTPNEQEGTNNIQIFFAAYVVDGASAADVAAYTSTDEKNPNFKKSKYYDTRNKDPRLFQLGSVLINFGKSKLIPGLEQGLFGMKIGQRRSILIPPESGYGEKGTSEKTFLRSVPPNATLLINIEIKKVIRG